MVGATTTVWVPLVTAGLGLLTGIGAAVGTAVLTQRRTDRREDVRWQREREALKEQWQRERETRWDQDRRAIYVRLLMATDEVYRSVDYQDEDGVPIPLAGSQRSIALAASDALYRAHTEVLLMRQSEDVQEAADKLSIATGALYEVVRVAKAEDKTERQRLKKDFGYLNSQRCEARDEFLNAAARELQIRQLGTI